MNDLTDRELELLVYALRECDTHQDDDDEKGDLLRRLLSAQEDRAQLAAFVSDCGDSCKL